MKWFGALLIISVSYLVGNIVSAEEKKKLTCIDSLLSLFNHMKRRMSAERKPLFSIFCEFGDRYLENVNFLERVRSNKNTKSVWGTAIALLDVDEETLRELENFGNELGELPLYEQLSRLDVLLCFLEEKKKTFQKTLPPKQKSVKTVCLLSGTLLAIIML